MPVVEFDKLSPQEQIKEGDALREELQLRGDEEAIAAAIARIKRCPGVQNHYVKNGKTSFAEVLVTVGALPRLKVLAANGLDMFLVSKDTGFNLADVAVMMKRPAIADWLRTEHKMLHTEGFFDRAQGRLCVAEQAYKGFLAGRPVPFQVKKEFVMSNKFGFYDLSPEEQKVVGNKLRETLMLQGNEEEAKKQIRSCFGVQNHYVQNGPTPFAHAPASMGALPKVKFLVDNGYDARITDGQSGDNILDVTVLAGKDAISGYLRSENVGHSDGFFERTREYLKTERFAYERLVSEMAQNRQLTQGDSRC